LHQLVKRDDDQVSGDFRVLIPIELASDKLIKKAPSASR